MSGAGGILNLRDAGACFNSGRKGGRQIFRWCELNGLC